MKQISPTNPPRYILPLIVVSQFAGTSVWFAGNAILPDLTQYLHLGKNVVSGVTSAVQLGFIAGTLVFAVLSLADRFRSSIVFLICSVFAALSNVAIVWLATGESSLLLFRFLTGFFLAGIYPIGMKIAADWYAQGLGKALGYLLGALVLGTAFPHLLKGNIYHFPWREVLYATSALALAGGLLMWLLVPEGPYRKRGSTFHPGALITIFRSKDFRAAAGGYFGHMWELYALFAFIPLLLQLHQQEHQLTYNIPLWSFIIIGSGGIGCIIGGYIARRTGSAKVAFGALLVSGLCCCICGLIIRSGTLPFLVFMVIWGATVSADSPQFSTLIAQTAIAENRGTALTFVICIGFAITIIGIQTLNYLLLHYPAGSTFLALAPGPLVGLYSVYRLAKTSRQ